MPFCPKCGYQIAETDSFCYQCGNKIEKRSAATPLQQQMANPSIPINPTPSTEPAFLSVCCLASSRSAYVNILPNDSTKKGTIIKPGQTAKIEYEPGEYIITFVVDRGPGLTLVASRITRYQKRLSFHPGETIVMDANVGHQMTQVHYKSSLGYQID